jgi:hypothetical protein
MNRLVPLGEQFTRCGPCLLLMPCAGRDDDRPGVEQDADDRLAAAGGASRRRAGCWSAALRALLNGRDSRRPEAGRAQGAILRLLVRRTTSRRRDLRSQPHRRPQRKKSASRKFRCQCGQYANLKRDLAARHLTSSEYTRAKTELIQELTDRARRGTRPRAGSRGGKSGTSRRNDSRRVRSRGPPRPRGRLPVGVPRQAWRGRAARTSAR